MTVLNVGRMNNDVQEETQRPTHICWRLRANSPCVMNI